MSNKKQLLILQSKKHKEDTSMYDVLSTNDIVTLWYSELDSGWRHPGKLAYILTVVSDGYSFVDSQTKQKIFIDYSQARALRALLKLVDDAKDTFELLERK